MAVLPQPVFTALLPVQRVGGVVLEPTVGLTHQPCFVPSEVDAADQPPVPVPDLHLQARQRNVAHDEVHPRRGLQWRLPQRIHVLHREACDPDARPSPRPVHQTGHGLRVEDAVTQAGVTGRNGVGECRRAGDVEPRPPRRRDRHRARRELIGRYVHPPDQQARPPSRPPARRPDEHDIRRDRLHQRQPVEDGRALDADHAAGIAANGRDRPVRVLEPGPVQGGPGPG